LNLRIRISGKLISQVARRTIRGSLQYTYKKSQSPDGSLKILDDRSFQVISNWYCIAIREMIKLDEFFEDPNWISKKLHFKVTPTEAARAIELLFQADLLGRDSKKSW
jgi:uncharacterized protein (TIGR02147 family)